MITSQVHLAAKTKDFIIQKNNKNGIKLSHESFSIFKKIEKQKFIIKNLNA